MDSVIAALQAQSDQLQSYLSVWSKEQQQILEAISVSRASPSSDKYICKQDSADKRTIPLASQIMAPTSISLPCDVSLENLKISETDERETASSAKAQTVIEQRTGATAGGLADASDCQAAQDVTNKPAEEYRHRLVEKFETALSSLTGDMCVNKENLKAWLTKTLWELETEISVVQELPDELVEDASPSRGVSAAVLDVLKDQHPKGFNEKFQLRKLIRSIVHSGHFESMSAAVIVVNAIVMGISADYHMANLDGAENSVLKQMELFFFGFYTLELILRLSNKPKHFFVGEDWRWNWFDLGLVFLSAYDLLGPLAMSSKGAPELNVSFLRLLRLLKMAKLLRMIRLMKMFKQLRLILASVFGSANAVFWAGVLVLIISYMASVLFVNLCSNFLMDATLNNVELSLDVRLGIEHYWGSVSTGMKSVFGATTGGDSWFNVLAPLSAIGWGAALLFNLYIGFFLVVILNTFSSLFVQSVFENVNQDDKELIQTEMEKKDMYIRQLQEFFDEIDEDASGTITLEEFVKHANDPKLFAWASALEIDISDAKYFFGILSNNGEFPIDIENFVVGCIQLKGTARSVDLMGVFQLAKEISKKCDACCLMLRDLMQPDTKTSQDVPSTITISDLFQLVIKVHRRCEEIAGMVCRNQERSLAATSLQPKEISLL